ncbi:hypothetical protein JOD24_001922 [Kroppenstedtia sanguinis]
MLFFKKEIRERMWNPNFDFMGNLLGESKRTVKKPLLKIDLESPIGENGGFKLGKQV